MDFTGSFTVWPEARFATRSVAFFSPLPASTSLPGPGTLTGSVAVPFFLFSFGLPRVNFFEESPSTATPQGMSAPDDEERVCARPVEVGPPDRACG